MKDIQISGNDIKKELLLFFMIFIFSNLVNILSIIIYKTTWKELYTSLGYVILLTLVIYFFILLVRYLVKLIYKVFK